MASMLAIQIIVFIINPESLISVIAGIAGVISVVLCAKGKISSYFIGFVQNALYTILAWQNRFYGEILEQIFYVVTMILGIFVWNKAMVTNEDGSTQVAVKKFTVKQWIIAAIATLIATFGLGYALDSIGSAQAYTDAATNIFAIFAQFMMVYRYREQWFWWFIIDVFCIKMWFVAGNWSMVAMYIAWTINTIYGWYNWSKLNKLQTKG